MILLRTMVNEKSKIKEVKTALSKLLAKSSLGRYDSSSVSAILRERQEYTRQDVGLGFTFPIPKSLINSPHRWAVQVCSSSPQQRYHNTEDFSILAPVGSERLPVGHRGIFKSSSWIVPIPCCFLSRLSL